MNKIFLYIIITLIFCVSFGQAQTYQITNLGTLGGDYSDADGGINNAGQVAGVSKTASGDYHAFFYDALTNQMRDIGTFGGDFSRPNGLNDNSLVVGRATLANGNSQAFLYNGATRILTNLHSSVTFGGTKSSALGINNNGQIVGWAENSSGKARAFYYNPATNQLVDLQAAVSLGSISTSIAYDINDSGKIVGAVESTNGFLRTIVWTCGANGCTTNTNFPLSSNNSPAAINNSGVFVGDQDATNQNDSFGYIYANEAIQNAVVGSCCDGVNNAKDLNNDAMVVGSFYNETLGSYHAFLTNTASSTTADLNTLIAVPGWNLLDAAGISDNGKIAGTGQINSELRAYVLTPSNFSLYTISGQIRRSDNSPVVGATVTLSGTASSATVTDANGSYSFNVAGGGNYTVTPTSTGNVFAPVSSTFNAISANQTADFTASPATFTISGNIQAGGVNLPGVTVALGGSQTGSTTTDASGNYFFAVNAFGNYTITPSKSGYVFGPANAAINNLQSDQTNVNFAATVMADATAWWRAESNALDAVGGSHGSLVGDTNFAAGKFGQSFNFDGAGDWVEVPNSPIVSRAANAPLTVNLWAYRNDAQDRVTLFSKRAGCDGTSINYQMGIHTGSGLGFFFGRGGAYARTGNDPVPVGQWTMLTGTFNGTTLRLYKNGVLLASVNGTMGPENAAPLKIGTSGECIDAYWRGRVDEMRIFDRALSQSEIQAIYSADTATYTIKGNITRGGSPLAGATVALSGSSSTSTTTDANGNYSFNVTAGGNYTITPSLGGNVFTPVSQTFNSVFSNQTANFTASLVTHTISGNITRNGSALSNVTVNLSGSATGSTTTDGNGNYSLTVNDGGNYTVTPALAGNVFTPTSRNFNNVTTDQIGNFTALFSTYTISGNVKADGANLAGAFVSLTGTQTQTTTTDANGNYTFTANTYGNYTIGVYKNSINFNPASQTFTNLQANQIANFQNGASYCAPAPSGLAAFYKGENNVVDLVTFNVGSMVNGATFADGKSGRAFSLNGSGNYVQISDNTSNSITGQITVQAWIKPNNVTPSQELINKYDGANNQRSFFLGLAGGNLTFWVSQTGAGSNFRSASTTNSPIAAGVFSQVTVTFNPTNQEMKIFVNGIDTNAGIVGGSTTINSILDSTAPLRFGTISGQDGFFGGLIDEVQLYNRVLSASEIAAIYNSGSTGVCTAAQIPAANGKIVFDSDRDSTGRRHLFTMNSDGTNVTQLTTGSGYNYFQASYSADGSRLVYTRYDYNLGTYDILRMDANGAQTNLTNDSFVDGSPAFSPDGGKIVYHSYQNNNYDIFMMNADGSNRVKLTNSAGNRYPSFSPDGSKIAFLSQRDGNQEVYIMNADGSNQTRLTNTPSGEDDAPSFSPDGAKIYFNSQRDGNSEIYVMNADGSNQTRLTNNTVGDYASSIAPDGAKIIFTSNRDGNEEIYTMNANGTNQTRVTTNAASDNEASWQPVRFQTYTPISTNGKIGFVSQRTGNNEIFTMNADGSNQTNVSNNAAVDDEPAWSPDGSKIAFTSDRNSNYEIYVMNADGTNQIRLTNDANADTVPGWSPDGTKIVFYSNRSGNGDIYIMNADGSNQTRLTTNTALDYVPKFSPDGSKIVFSSQRDGNDEIYIMNTDGSNQTRLTNNSTVDQSPAFSPDGSKIAFTSNRVGNYEVFVMNADGSNPVNLSNNSAVDVRPAWSPDGTKISFETTRDGTYEIYVINADGTNQTRLTNNTVTDYYTSWQRAYGNVSVVPASNMNLTFSNVSQAGSTVATPIAPSSAGALPSGYQLVSQSIAYDIRTSAQLSGNITMTINVPNVPDSATCQSLRLLHYETSANGLVNVTSGTNAYNSATQICTVSGVTTSLSPFVVAQTLAPTASGVSISGRVITPVDLGLTGALVTLTDSHGTARTIITGKFGSFVFRNVAAGETYILTVSSKRYTYAPQVVTPTENMTGIIFTAQ